MSEIAGNRVLLFSYGSGMAASMFAIQVSKNYCLKSSLYFLHQNIIEIPVRLENRFKMSPKDFNEILIKKEKNFICPFSPSSSIENLFPDTYYLTSVDEAFRRKYKRLNKPIKS